jgi:hypothetical protein
MVGVGVCAVMATETVRYKCVSVSGESESILYFIIFIYNKRSVLYITL